ncbi:unnamed protein product [Cuscuta epithymum]|uniref:Uncharacterized protein n=1 Tax=Cuscuta epithymum TaxID=186058 RepID=A0AAV0FW07_9ASTE|nr:unnamed protein product [Cuscuta epithymum]
MMAREDLQWISSPLAKLSEAHLNQLEVKPHRMEDRAELQETERGEQSAEGGARKAECGAAQDGGQTVEAKPQSRGGRRRSGQEDNHRWLLFQRFGDCVLT